MRRTQSERRTSCTVAVELNQYGAMTLRSETGRTYQVVDVDERSSSGSRPQADNREERSFSSSRAEPGDSESPTITDKLAELGVDSQVSVTLQQAHGRGNIWRVTEIESDDATRQAVRPLNR
ncbi:hypothetical protein halTADL_1189 [Halohasta litchfieldiae]|jgi:hypothetical protein|uniref:DUF7999 domain-containing protein n=1 Tax=Halohasta litchfieldiae TaxID=1073996 RepID=A0A1H6S5A8_9EURY|nr:hypothetical protein [Halohasta litchfieldiae]ATW87982.1 hypothetical protein halTADL_1189 [Halohasta litchfieldiae]SEI61054.1 hypothetical protein SAMN05444271_1045 [Halohasta litchfieldiae]